MKNYNFKKIKDSNYSVSNIYSKGIKIRNYINDKDGNEIFIFKCTQNYGKSLFSKSIESSVFLNQNEYTVETWIKLIGYENGDKIYTWGYCSPSGHFTTGKNIFPLMFNDPTNGEIIFSPPKSKINEYCHLAITKEKNIMKFYWNGEICKNSNVILK